MSTRAVTSLAKRAKTATPAPAEMVGADARTMTRLRDAEQPETGATFLNAKPTADVPRALKGYYEIDVTGKG